MAISAALRYSFTVKLRSASTIANPARATACSTACAVELSRQGSYIWPVITCDQMSSAGNEAQNAAKNAPKGSKAARGKRPSRTVLL